MPSLEDSVGAYTGVLRLQGLPGGRGSRSLAGSAGLGWTHRLVQAQASPGPLQAVPWHWACLKICQSGAPGQPYTLTSGCVLAGSLQWGGGTSSLAGALSLPEWLETLSATSEFLLDVIHRKASPGETSPPHLALFLPTVWSSPLQMPSLTYTLPQHRGFPLH